MTSQPRSEHQPPPDPGASRESAERQFREQAEHLNIALEAARQGAWQLDLATGAFAATPQARRNLGLAPDAEVTFEQLFAGVHPEDREKREAALRCAIEERGPYECEFRVIWPDGTVHWLYAIGRVVDGETPRLYVVNTEITGRKQAEAEREQLLAAERAARGAAERANRMKDEFLATVSHELRTPLTAILGWAHLLLDMVDNEEAREGVEIISRNARAQRQLIDDLLDMSRILVGKMHLQIGPVLIGKVIRAAIETVGPATRARDVSIQTRIKGCDEPIQADPDRLQQVIWNLLSNAVKFTPNGGRVEIATECLDNTVRVSVRDTGKGMEPDFVPQIFERFRQADSSSSRQQGGLGLGLAIVKHLVELHGGSISAHSDGPGKGSVFTLILPVTTWRFCREPSVKREASSHVHAATRKSELGGLRVLVIDDEADTRMYLHHVLVDRGATVSAAESAAEGLRRLVEDRPDVVLCDIGMPGEDGYSFIRNLRASAEVPLAKTPAAALTAFARTEDQERAIAEGFNKHCSKPVEPAELAELVKLLARQGGS